MTSKSRSRKNIVVNSKVQNPSAPNSLDTLLVHQGIARPLLSALILRLLDEFKIDIYGCPKPYPLMGQMLMTGHKAVKPAQRVIGAGSFRDRAWPSRWCRVSTMPSRISQHGPSHTCVIVTKSYESAMRFTREG